MRLIGGGCGRRRGINSIFNNILGKWMRVRLNNIFSICSLFTTAVGGSCLEGRSWSNQKLWRRLFFLTITHNFWSLRRRYKVLLKNFSNRASTKRKWISWLFCMRKKRRFCSELQRINFVLLSLNLQNWPHTFITRTILLFFRNCFSMSGLGILRLRRRESLSIGMSYLAI